MADVENLVFEPLPPVRAAVEDRRCDMRGVRARLGVVGAPDAGLSGRGDRAGRIERRLGLAGA